MRREKRWLLVVILVGGPAVLASYAWGLGTQPALRDALWGGVPAGLRPLYAVSMLVAAASYMAFTYFLLFRVDAAAARVAGRLKYGVFVLLYALILVPSALWMPLTLVMLEDPRTAVWLTIRVVLWVVALGSLGLMAALMGLDQRLPRRAYWSAVAGSALFSVHTVVLDALLWPAYFEA